MPPLEIPRRLLDSTRVPVHDMSSMAVEVYAFCFFPFNVFPMIISEGGPSLDVISLLYTVEGLLQAGFWHGSL